MDSLFLLDSFSFRLGPLERNGKDTVRSVQFNSLDTHYIFIEKKRFENDSDGDTYSDIGTGGVNVVNTCFNPKS